VTWQVASGPREPWRLWNPDQGEPSYSANFYTATEPYLRRRVTVTHMSLAEAAEARERQRGYVTLPELPASVIEHWATSDASWLAADILRHLARG
jgi:hypothetical protein